jgi:hypothetical protein
MVCLVMSPIGPKRSALKTREHELMRGENLPLDLEGDI